MATDNADFTMFYSAGRRGFFHGRLHKTAMPADAVGISDADHAALLEAQNNGQEIVPDENGLPVARDPTITIEMQRSALKGQIALIESQQGRAMREAIIGIPGALDHLKTIHKKIADLDAQLAALS
jgi:hypothetical protein